MMIGLNRSAAEVVKRIPKGSVGVEIGVWKGDSSAQFLKRTGHLHLVDPWSVDAFRSSDEFGGFRLYLQRYSEMVGATTESAFQAYYDLVYASVKRRFINQSVTIHRCTSGQFFSTNQSKFDWFYIDGSHTYDGCLADLNSAHEIATYAIFGDDYRTKTGVTKAVDAFIKKTGLELDIFGRDQYQVLV